MSEQASGVNLSLLNQSTSKVLDFAKQDFAPRRRSNCCRRLTFLRSVGKACQKDFEGGVRTINVPDQRL